MGGLTATVVPVIEVDDDLARETDCRFAHVPLLKTIWGFDNDHVGACGKDLAPVHHRPNGVVHLKSDLTLR